MTHSIASALAALEPIAVGVLAPNAAAVDAGAQFPRANLDSLAAAGLLGLVTPVEHGGHGLGLEAAARVVHRIAQECGTTAMVVCMHYCGATVLAQLGSPEVNRAIAAGRHLSTLAFSEAGSRSHFWAPVSTARLDGDQVILDAEKSWITSARQATAYVWSSKPAAAEGASSLWLVPVDSAGLSVPRPFDGLGLRGNDSAPVTASGVRIPAANRLGADGGGFDIMMGTVLPLFNVCNAACSLGLADAAVTRACAHASDTRYAHLGSAIRDLPTVRAYLARARIQVDSGKALWEDTLAALAAGRPDAMLRVLEIKAAAGEIGREATTTAMRVCGGAAYRKDVGVERNFRDAQAMGVMAPTTDVLYEFIGRAICGMDLF